MADTDEDHIIRVRGLVTRFGTHTVHEGLDLDVRRGEIIGVVGGSGTGKSVLLRAIVGLLKPNAGRIEVFGESVRDTAPEDYRRLRRRWGVMFQDGALFSSLSVRQNVEAPMREQLRLDDDLRETLAGIKVRMVGLPENALAKYPSELSGGMRKRAGFARAISLDPEIVFLDEPTAGLDPIGAAAFDRLIKQLQAALGLTVFLVTHDLDSLHAICDRVAVLADKKVLAVGTMKDMLEIDHPWVREYFHGPRARAAIELIDRIGGFVMETRANFILIGAFTLLAILGTLGFFVWLASVQIDRQYQTYGILFDDVSGLDPSGDVLFNGISVGQVIGLRIYEKDPSKVFTTIEIDATTPVRSDTVAQLQSQGVTGVSYISLSGGTSGAKPLTSSDENPPIIPSRRSTVQTLVEDAPDILAETTRLLEQFQQLIGPENQSYVSNILRNLETSSGQLDQALSDFSTITGTVRDATTEITRFTGRLDTIGADVETTLERANAALGAAERAFETANTTLDESRPAIASVDRAFTEAEQVLIDRVPELLTRMSDAVARAGAAVSDLQDRSGVALDGYTRTAKLLNQRLIELEKTLLDANTAFAAVTEASDSFDTLVDGDGTLLVAEARDVLVDAKAAIGTIEAVVLNDVPAVVADIRTAVATASDAVERVAADLTGLTGRFDPLADRAEDSLTAATSLLGRAGTTLDALDRTLAGADGALSAAETAFDAATGVLQTDLDPVLNDIRTASDRISVAVEDVTRDLPAIAEDLRNLIARADRTVAQVQGVVNESAPGISDFARTGLPELTRLGTEARNLVTSLNTLVRRIEQNPTRFLLDNRVPEYRR